MGSKITHGQNIEGVNLQWCPLVPDTTVLYISFLKGMLPNLTKCCGTNQFLFVYMVQGSTNSEVNHGTSCQLLPFINDAKQSHKATIWVFHSSDVEITENRLYYCRGELKTENFFRYFRVYFACESPK